MTIRNLFCVPLINPEIPEDLLKRYKPVRVTPKRAALRFDIVRITPTSAIYFNTNLADEKFGIYQYWERKDQIQIENDKEKQ